MLSELEKAERYIFLEYFTIHPVWLQTPAGESWRSKRMFPYGRNRPGFAPPATKDVYKRQVQLFHPEYDVDVINGLFMQKKFDEMRQRLHHDKMCIRDRP